MKHGIRLAVLATGLAMLAGCGVTGQWTLDSITPEDARGNYAFASVTLNDDGTYTATSMQGGERSISTGTYTYDDETLTFMTASGKTRTYDARTTSLGSKLQVKTMVKGEEVTAVMKRD